MGIYYYAIDHENKKYFSAPEDFSKCFPGIFHQENPFCLMIVMKNLAGCHFVIQDDSSHDIPPSSGYEDVTASAFAELIQLQVEGSR